jgi:hypothetical protein
MTIQPHHRNSYQSNSTFFQTKKNSIMSTKRKASSRSVGPAPKGGQSTISFGQNRVTKHIGPPGKILKGLPAEPLLQAAISEDEDSKALEAETVDIEHESEAPAPAAVEKTLTKEEEMASEVPQKAIAKYWKGVEGRRIAPRGNITI